jgi:tRNA threonylcarbamoyladenosine biosynthesis protein TsaE
MLKYKCPTEVTLLSVASLIAANCGPSITLFLRGPLGAGKTTFARGFLRGLGYLGKVKSPTYNLVEPYELDGKTIFHFDFYRISDPKELSHLGLEEYFRMPAMALIEWPENGFSYLQMPDLDCTISFAESGRNISLNAMTDKGECLLNAINK